MKLSKILKIQSLSLKLNIKINITPNNENKSVSAIIFFLEIFDITY